MRHVCNVMVVKKLLIGSFCTLLTYGCWAQQKKPSENAHLQNNLPSSKQQTISYQITHSNNQGYGYCIFIGNTLFIHQPVIPCVAGKKSFRSKGDAKKVAGLVINKMRKGIMPPTISLSEMERLGIDLR